ncbi:GDSL esterase/lipase At5g33370-like [Phalaenopsis equestris]|uniref:GDSL esterase/lipase At5g33370-like n=1 Tax=Phalaenopsis equestris TaxID=78828 RepID=UPI0009E5BA96|nr:GDSL esterase/lipase At5g33370-like [Phalaenopsis equestris]
MEMQRIYELGGRRVLVTRTGPLGCVPAELAQRSRNGACDPKLQRASELYNPQLEKTINQLNSQYHSNIFIAANTAKLHSDFISNPQASGFITSKRACCGQGPYNGLGLCTVAPNLCPNRDLYAFWDPFHPSAKASRIIVGQFMTGSSEYMNPMNLSTLLAMGEST